MSEKIEFQPPRALELGNPKPGERIGLMTEYEVAPDGRLCLAQIEGVNMPGYDPDGSPKYRDDTKSKTAEAYLKAYPG